MQACIEKQLRKLFLLALNEDRVVDARGFGENRAVYKSSWQAVRKNESEHLIN